MGRFLARDVSATTLFLILVWPVSSYAASFAYGTVSPYPGGRTLLRYSLFESSQSYICPPDTASCLPAQDIGIDDLPPFLIDKDALWDRERMIAVVRTRSSLGTRTEWQNSLYDFSSGLPVFRNILPVTARVYRVFASAKNDIVVVTTGSHVIRVNAATNRIVDFFSLPPDESMAFSRLSPSGRYLAYYRPATPGKTPRAHVVIDLVRGRSYASEEALSYWDLLGEENRIFEFSPDETRMFYLSDRAGWPTLYATALPLAGSRLPGERLITKPYAVADFVPLSAREIVFVANREGAHDWRLYRFDMSTGRLREIAASVSYGVPLRAIRGKAFFGVLVPGGVAIRDYDSVADTIHEPAGTVFPGEDVVASGKEVTIGTARAVVSEPDGGARGTIIWLHGGPYRQAALGYHPYASYGVYDWILEKARRDGFRIVKLDYRGSYGYGRAFAESLRLSVGKGDVADVLATQKNFSDGPVYLMGVSYGGYLALRSLAEAPKLFAGAISVNGVIDWQALVERDPRSLFAPHFGGIPTAKTKKYYDAASIVNRVKSFTSAHALLVVHAKKDSSVSFTQGEIMQAALSAMGRSGDFVSYPDEDHVFTKRGTVEDVCRRVLATLGLTAGDSCTLRPID